MLRILTALIAITFVTPFLNAQDKKSDYQIHAFGENGQVKMTYDARQRPNCVLVDEKIFLVYNAGAKEGASGESKTKPEARTYDLVTGEFSEVVGLGKASNDHHDGPVIWVDMEEKLHVFYGWHHDLGTHLVSNEAKTIGTSLSDWSTSPAPSPKMS